MLFTHWIPWALALALLSAGNSRAAKMAMIAITTNNSIKVNALAGGPRLRGRIFIYKPSRQREFPLDSRDTALRHCSSLFISRTQQATVTPGRTGVRQWD